MDFIGTIIDFINTKYDVIYTKMPLFRYNFFYNVWLYLYKNDFIDTKYGFIYTKMPLLIQKNILFITTNFIYTKLICIYYLKHIYERERRTQNERRGMWKTCWFRQNTTTNDVDKSRLISN